MSVVLRLLLIAASILSSVYVLGKIRKSQMKIESAIFWFGFSALLILFSIFPEIAYALADVVGVESTVNLVYLIIIFLLLMKVFSLSVKVSQLEYKLTILTEELAIANHISETDKMEKVILNDNTDVTI